MKITWLGQGGVYLETESISILIDPYLSDAIGKANPDRVRRIPIDESFLALNPDVLIFTHDHLDHYDPDTAPHFLHKTEKAMTVLCPSSVWKRARTEGGGHNYVQFNRHTEWTEGGMRFRAVKAEHSDDYAIGVLIEDLAEGKVYYVTGDTLYSTEVIADVDTAVDVLMLPINGAGNNMNAVDAARFATAIGAKMAIPIHYGLYDTLDPAAFAFPGRRISAIYETITL
ncbi:MAG: MBL fold metallo-hydrolase [Clostridia bacterium]|nr:MBL fold metallo-hydrolase [Clostridia bacterium]